MSAKYPVASRRPEATAQAIKGTLLERTFSNNMHSLNPCTADAPSQSPSSSSNMLSMIDIACLPMVSTIAMEDNPWVQYEWRSIWPSRNSFCLDGSAVKNQEISSPDVCKSSRVPHCVQFYWYNLYQYVRTIDGEIAE